MRFLKLIGRVEFGWCRVDNLRESIENMREEIWDLKSDLYDIREKLGIIKDDKDEENKGYG